ncbi:RNA-directed DNA polymerase from mobile element jockey [Trichonephila clavipes]|nr:RNA-directed DNA polymerase from mobile element jockey [Trichonephila clavipes]
MELKCRQHVTLSEARRRFRASNSENLSTVLKSKSQENNIQESIDKKFEKMMTAFLTVVEKQTAFPNGNFTKINGNSALSKKSNSKNSTPGADHITASFLKNLDRNGCEIILRYFQDLFDNAIVPNSWKHAVILSIPKQCKDKTRISSYRPIALTSIFSKTFERVLTNRLSYFLTTERKLHPQHYGFVPFKDSRSATYLIHKAIMDAKLKKKYFVGVSLDIKNAYDSVYVDGLLYKCLQIGITGKTAIWIHKFLTYRSFQIKWRAIFPP